MSDRRLIVLSLLVLLAGWAAVCIGIGLILLGRGGPGYMVVAAGYWAGSTCWAWSAQT